MSSHPSSKSSKGVRAFAHGSVTKHTRVAVGQRDHSLERRRPNLSISGTSAQFAEATRRHLREVKNEHASSLKQMTSTLPARTIKPAVSDAVAYWSPLRLVLANTQVSRLEPTQDVSPSRHPSPTLSDTLERLTDPHLTPTRVAPRGFLPTEALVTDWICIALDNAFTLWPLLQIEDLAPMIKRCYNTRRFMDININWDELALVYAVIALGQSFDPLAVPQNEHLLGRQNINGSAYLQASRALVDLQPRNRTLSALQTLICTAIYFCSNAAFNLSRTYVSSAVHAAIRMGIDKRSRGQSRVERDQLACTWTCLQTIDAYVAGLLGLPRCVQRTTNASDSGSSTEPSPLESARRFLKAFEVQSEFYQDTFSGSGDECGVNVTSLRNTQSRLGQWYDRCISRESRGAGNNVAELQIRQLYGYMHLLLHAPFIEEEKDPSVKGTPLERIHGASIVVETAECLDSSGLLHPKHACTVPAISLAAATLLQIERIADQGERLVQIRLLRIRAIAVLEGLAARDSIASQCLTNLKALL